MRRKRKKNFTKFILLIVFLLCVFILPDSINQKRLEPSDIEVKQDPVQQKVEEKQPDRLISVSFGGDVMMDSYFADYIHTYGVDYSWTDITPLLKQSDISVVNLETSVSDRGKTYKAEGYGFRSQPFTLEGLANADVDLVSLANNHTYDFGTTAFLDTLSHLHDYGIEYCGAGKNLEEAMTLKIIQRNDLRVGFLNFSEIIPSRHFLAGEDKPGIASILKDDYDQVFETIHTAKQNCDLLFVLLHWGVEYSDTPEEYQIDLAHQIIDHGADALIGHHPHVLQGIEIYKEKPILYSIGNFIFLKRNDQAGKTALFELNFNADEFQGGSFYPIHIKHCKANLLKDEDAMKSEIIHHMIELSKPFETTITEQGVILRK